jgi:uncharacterized phage infection (PIP) family protein YhgE
MVSYIADLHAELADVKRKNEQLTPEVERLRSQLRELKESAVQCDNNLSTADQNAKEAKHLRTTLQAKEDQLQQQPAALSDVKSELTLKDTTLNEAQAQTNHERKTLKEVQAHLAEAEQKARQAEQLATALKEKSDALVTVKATCRRSVPHVSMQRPSSSSSTWRWSVQGPRSRLVK